jgi:hypothetical protein
MTTEIKIEDLAKPVSKAEIEARLKDLTPSQLEEARRQQVDQAILNPKEDKEPDWSRLSDAEFNRQRLLRYGW